MKSFLSLNSGTKLLFMEAFFYLGWARLLKALPFAKVAPSLGIRMMETDLAPNPAQRNVIKHISQAIQVMSRYTWWESMCLVKAIAGMKMLERRGIESTLYLGTARDESGSMIAHAWLRSGPYYISGYEEMERFTVVAKFGNVSKRQANQRGAVHG